MNCCFCPKCEMKTPSKQVRLCLLSFPETTNQQTNIVFFFLPQGLKLLSLPQILCLNLKRFRNSCDKTRKLDCMVTFPETFDFSETLKAAFSSDFDQQVQLFPVNYPFIECNFNLRVCLLFQNDCKYTLYAVVVHSGYAMFGHYTAFVRRNQHWYYADDSRVKQVEDKICALL